MKQVEPGDRIILLRDPYRLQIHTLDSFEYFHNNEKYDYFLYTRKNRSFLVKEGEFEVLEPSTYMPVVGDQIIVTNKRDDRSLACRKFRVIEPQSHSFLSQIYLDSSKYCPLSAKDISECIWCEHLFYSVNDMFWISRGNYETVKRQTQGSCKDCGGTGKIMLLTSTIKCGSCNS